MVHFLLVSGPDAALSDFHTAVAERLLLQERRKQMLNYTCMAEDLEFAKKVAGRLEITLQEIERGEGKETYKILVQNSELVWPYEIPKQ